MTDTSAFVSLFKKFADVPSIKSGRFQGRDKSCVSITTSNLDIQNNKCDAHAFNSIAMHELMKSSIYVYFLQEKDSYVGICTAEKRRI